MKTVTLLVLALATSIAYADPTPKDLLADLGLDDKTLASVMAGKFVRLSPAETDDRDLAVGFVFFVPQAPKALAAELRRSKDFQADPAVVRSHRIDSAADFATVELSPNGDAEKARYLAAAPGDTLNLSADEIAKLHELAPGADRAAVEATIKKLLDARFVAYRARGLDGISPYARDKGKEVRPGETMRHAVSGLRLIDKYGPAFKALLLGYPTAKPPGFDEVFYWVVYALDGRPTLSLRHRMSVPSGDGIFVSDREFYVSQGHDDTQAVAALLPVEGGTIVFYATHTSTGRVAGAASSTKHSIGRRIMGKQLEQIFERARTKH